MSYGGMNTYFMSHLKKLVEDLRLKGINISLCKRPNLNKEVKKSALS